MNHAYVAVPCSFCGAVTDQPCVKVRGKNAGQPADWTHAQRGYAYFEACREQYELSTSAPELTRGASVALKVKTYLACERCGKEFGGPDAGDYPGWDPDQLHTFLLAEAQALFWIEISCGTASVLVCSKRCGRAWIADPDECFASSR